ncbi:MAG TPA: hypothetical protein ENH28_07600 [Euryarchaeota archaeon]|nr:hypothetical protein [Euryarchaeota archaeon]
MSDSTNNTKKKGKNGLFAGGMILIFVIGIFAGFMVGEFTHTKSRTQAQELATTAQPYRLSLVEIMDVSYNKAIGAQPKFYVVGANGDLESSANITFPAHRSIVLTITSYDMGNAPTAAQYAKVSGTVNNQMTLINGTIASGDNTSQIWKTTVSSVPVSDILHTFTIPSLHINIPVVAGFTETMVISPISKTGSYHWQCESACGSGKSGWEGAMAASGWMMGTVNVV